MILGDEMKSCGLGCGDYLCPDMDVTSRIYEGSMHKGH